MTSPRLLWVSLATLTAYQKDPGSVKYFQNLDSSLVSFKSTYAVWPWQISRCVGIHAAKFGFSFFISHNSSYWKVMFSRACVYPQGRGGVSQRVTKRGGDGVGTHWYRHLVAATKTCTVGKRVVRILLECFLVLYVGITLSAACNEQKKAKNTARCKWVLIVTQLFNIFDANLWVVAGCSLQPMS